MATARAFLEALTLALRALTPFLAELAVDARRKRLEAEYRGRVDGIADALGKEDAVGVSAAWAAFDDDLLSGGITTEDDSGSEG